MSDDSKLNYIPWAIITIVNYIINRYRYNDHSYIIS